MLDRNDNTGRLFSIGLGGKILDLISGGMTIRTNRFYHNPTVNYTHIVHNKIYKIQFYTVPLFNNKINKIVICFVFNGTTVFYVVRKY